MYRNATTCQNGPVSRSRAWSQDDSAAELPLGDSGGRLNLPPSQGGNELRLELVARVRKEIAAGTYDTPEKLEVAFERLLERLDQV